MMLTNRDIQELLNSAEEIVSRVNEGQERLKKNDAHYSQRYRDNMNLFAAVMPHIYDSFKDYEPKNRAVFAEENGDLNLYDADSKATLFTRKPRESAEEKVANFIETPLKTYIDFARNQRHPSRHVFYGNQMIEAWYGVKESFEKPKGLPKYVPSMIFFGVEFGYQLESLISQCDIKHLYIYERELDYFYYSLFAIDWLPILEHFNRDGHTINFLLGVMPRDITDKYLVQLEENGFFWAPETYIYRAYKSEKMQESVLAFQESYPRQATGWGFFDDALIGIAQGMRSLSKMNLCKMDLGKKLPRWQQDIPVFILGNGPSLDHGIELLKEIKDKVFIISCGSTINTLRRVGIRPDFQVDVERMKQTVDKFSFFEKEELKGIIGLTVDVMHPDFYQYFERTITAGKPGEAIVTLIGTALAAQGESYMQLNNSGPFVANLALSYCQYFGFRNLYFLGVDNGYIDPDNHHSKHSGYYKDGQETGFQSFRRAKTKTYPGNFGGVVHSTNEMNLSRLQLEALLNRMKKQGGVYCYNLSDGAKINGADPLKVEDVMIFDPPFEKEQVIQTIYDTFTTTPPVDLVNETPESVLKLESFMEACEMLKSGWDESIVTREDLCQLLWRYHRALYLMKPTANRIIYDLLKGSYTAAAFNMLSISYQIEDEEVAMQKARGIYEIWLQFLGEMPEMLRQASSFIDDGNEHLIKHYNG